MIKLYGINDTFYKDGELQTELRKQIENNDDYFKIYNQVHNITCFINRYSYKKICFDKNNKILLPADKFAPGNFDLYKKTIKIYKKEIDYMASNCSPRTIKIDDDFNPFFLKDYRLFYNDFYYYNEEYREYYPIKNESFTRISIKVSGIWDEDFPQKYSRDLLMFIFSFSFPIKSPYFTSYGLVYTIPSEFINPDRHITSLFFATQNDNIDSFCANGIIQKHICFPAVHVYLSALRTNKEKILYNLYPIIVEHDSEDINPRHEIIILDEYL